MDLVCGFWLVPLSIQEFKQQMKATTEFLQTLIVKRSKSSEIKFGLLTEESPSYNTSLDGCVMNDIPIKQEDIDEKTEVYNINVKTVDTAMQGEIASHNSKKNLQSNGLEPNQAEIELQPKCQICKATFASRKSYNAHIYRLPETSIKYQKYRCRVCNPSREYPTSKQMLKEHLHRKHKICWPFYDRELSNPNIKPDPNDPENYCQLCDFKYSTRYTFHGHLYTIHKIELPITRKRLRPNPDIRPDPNNPNYYCQSCNYKFTARYSFRVHLSKIHNIDVNKPDPTTH